jgi:hypothetical protein
MPHPKLSLSKQLGIRVTPESKILLDRLMAKFMHENGTLMSRNVCMDRLIEQWAEREGVAAHE